MSAHTARPAADSAAAHRPFGWRAHRAAAAACATATPLQATAAAPLWRALIDQSAIWLLTARPGTERER